MEKIELEPGQKVLILWSHLPKCDQLLKEIVENCNSDVGSSGTVNVENAERLSQGGHTPASFDVIISGLIPPHSVVHDLDLLGRIAELTKPGGRVYLAQAIISSPGADDEKEKFLRIVTLSGLILGSVSELEIKDPEYFRQVLDVRDNSSYEVIEVQCQAPNFEVGSSSLLSFAKKPNKTPSKETEAVWNLDDDDLNDSEVEILDSDQLLDEEDLKKPDVNSLRVCGTTGRRKACKDCSCGLSEELEAGKEPGKKDITSSCGSCYLGDAFRCASCPYLGMPAFKPGEKIALSDRQLQPDK